MLEIRELSYEEAATTADEMSGAEVTDLQSGSVHRGHHASHGSVAIMVNAAGGSFMVKQGQ